MAELDEVLLIGQPSEIRLVIRSRNLVDSSVIVESRWTEENNCDESREREKGRYKDSHVSSVPSRRFDMVLVNVARERLFSRFGEDQRGGLIV